MGVCGTVSRCHSVSGMSFGTVALGPRPLVLNSFQMTSRYLGAAVLNVKQTHLNLYYSLQVYVIVNTYHIYTR
jgi:hypothetical protein